MESPTPAPTPPPTPFPTPPPTPPCPYSTCTEMKACGGDPRMYCRSAGDPHVRTFAGRTAHPQGRGPFTLAKTTDGAIDVQVCHRPLNSRVSINKMAAIKTAKWGTVKYYGGRWHGDFTKGISCSGSTCTLPTGEKVTMSGSTVSVSMGKNRCRAVRGLCGQYDPANFADFLDGFK